jgi:hypothetical protein
MKKIKIKKTPRLKEFKVTQFQTYETLKGIKLKKHVFFQIRA